MGSRGGKASFWRNYPLHSARVAVNTKLTMTITDKVRLTVPRETYENLVKNECVICDSPLSGTVEYYETAGNFCPTCNARAGRNIMNGGFSEKRLDEAFRGMMQDMV